MMMLGCASPGPPRAPSLYLPKVISDLTVQRAGDRVELRFTAPSRTTDNLPLKSEPLHGALCRELAHKACVPTGTTQTFNPSQRSAPQVVTWTDNLPADLTRGPAGLLGYRVELFNAAGQSAGRSDVAYTVAGRSPEPVEHLAVSGSRLGAVLQWDPAPNASGDVILHREDQSEAAKPGTAELLVSAADAARGRALDATAKPETPYRYTAERRLAVQSGGRALEIRSASSKPVEFVLHLVYPPLPPTGLTVVGYVAEKTASAPANYTVDLIWQPVDDAGLLAGLAGYNVYREGHAGRAKLNAAPLLTSAYKDTTAQPTEQYRYSVTAIDGKGNESPATAAVLEPDAKP
jgi:hypothetical protein